VPPLSLPSTKLVVFSISVLSRLPFSLLTSSASAGLVPILWSRCSAAEVEGDLLCWFFFRRLLHAQRKVSAGSNAFRSFPFTACRFDLSFFLGPPGFVLGIQPLVNISFMFWFKSFFSPPVFFLVYNKLPEPASLKSALGADVRAHPLFYRRLSPGASTELAFFPFRPTRCFPTTLSRRICERPSNFRILDVFAPGVRFFCVAQVLFCST